MYRQQNHQQARLWADSNHRSPVYETGALTTMLQSHVTEVSSSTLPDMVMVKKPKEPMTIKSMQNVPRAKYSEITEAIMQIRTTDLLFTRQKNNHYAREP